jgi:hypothetical protein
MHFSTIFSSWGLDLNSQFIFVGRLACPGICTLLPWHNSLVQIQSQYVNGDFLCRGYTVDRFDFAFSHKGLNHAWWTTYVDMYGWRSTTSTKLLLDVVRKQRLTQIARSPFWVRRCFAHGRDLRHGVEIFGDSCKFKFQNFRSRSMECSVRSSWFRISWSTDSKFSGRCPKKEHDHGLATVIWFFLMRMSNWSYEFLYLDVNSTSSSDLKQYIALFGQAFLAFLKFCGCFWAAVDSEDVCQIESWCGSFQFSHALFLVLRFPASHSTVRFLFFMFRRG